METAAILKLYRAGFSTEQVEALVDLFDTQASSKPDLARETSTISADTKAASHRIEQQFANVHAALAGLRSDLTALDHQMKAMEYRLTIKFGGMLVVIIGLTVAALRYLPALT